MFPNGQRIGAERSVLAHGETVRQSHQRHDPGIGRAELIVKVHHLDPTGDSSRMGAVRLDDDALSGGRLWRAFIAPQGTNHLDAPQAPGGCEDQGEAGGVAKSRSHVARSYATHRNANG